VTCLSGPIRRLCAGALALAIGVVCLPSPCRADEPAARTSTRSIATLSPATLARLAPQAAQTETASGESGAFFKTKKGAAVLVLLGAGFGYALYSRSHDEIKSAIRQ
jgi:hypothetical protein